MEPQPATLAAQAAPMTQEQKPAQEHSHGRNYGLDLLRSIAIGLVLLDHGTYLFYDRINQFIGNNLTLTGYWGVQLFFVLSGFLIGGILIKEVTKKAFTTQSLLTFWKRRWYRTLPNYYLFLIIFFIIYLTVPASFLAARTWHEPFSFNHVQDIAYYPFFLQNFLVTNIPFMGHSWSLAVEEWFYLILPSFIFVVLYLNKRTPVRQKLIACFIGMAAVFMMVRIAGLMQVWPHYTKLSVICNLDNLMFGVIMAWLFTFYKAEVLKRKNLLLMLAIPAFCLGFVLQNKFILTGKPNLAWDALIVPMHAFAFVCALPWFYGIKINKRSWLSRVITEVSVVSYSMYLIHFIVLVFIIDTMQINLGIRSLPGSIGLFILFIILTVLLSSLNYQVFEKRMTALRDRKPKNQESA